MTNIFTYRAIAHGYELTSDYAITVEGIKADSVVLDLISLSQDGVLHLHRGFQWDGASGPALDTHNFIRGSMVHDALYFLIAHGHLPRTLRLAADAMLYKICREDGMTVIRAWYVWSAVRIFGRRYVLS